MQREEIIDAMACVAQHVLGRKVVEFARILHEGDQIAVLRDIPVESNTRFPYQMVVESASRKWLTSKDFQSLIPTVSNFSDYRVNRDLRDHVSNKLILIIK